MTINNMLALVRGQWGYLLIACLALIAAAAFEVFGAVPKLPVLGSLPLFPTTLAAAGLGLASIHLLTRRGIAPPSTVTWRGAIQVTLLGAALALPPIAIDLALPFPRDMNLPLPEAALFYPAIALVAEVVFHLLPLAMFGVILGRRVVQGMFVVLVMLIEPLFQVAFLPEFGLQSMLVLGSVGLISAAQLWLFLRHGFLAMFGLRIAFYMCWHILWGALRLVLLP